MSKKSTERYYIRTKRAYIGNEPTPGDKAGDRSERLFHHLVNLLISEHRVPWLLGIGKVSSAEDWLQRIDFRLRAFCEGEHLSEFLIPIQIKSSHFAALEFAKEKPDSDIHVIVMARKLDLTHLHEMLDGIYLSEVEKRYATLIGR